MPQAPLKTKQTGRARNEKKTASGRINAAKAQAARRKPLCDIPCGCAVASNETNPEKHLRSCLRRRAILRRQNQGIPLDEKAP